VEHHEPGPLGERYLPALDVEVAGVGGEVAFDGLQVAEGVAPGFQGRAVEHVHEHRAPFDAAQEFQPEALALARPREEPGNVGDGDTEGARSPHAEVGYESGEGIASDVRLGGGDHGAAGRFARGGEAYEPNI